MVYKIKSIRGAVLFLLLVLLISFEISPTATASGGDIWTSRSSAADNNWRSVTYGNGLFVAVADSGSGNRVMSSPDGITWTSRTSAADTPWRSVTYGNGLFVAVAINGIGNRVMTSPNGITWTSRTSAADNNWYGVTYGNGLFVAVAFSGTGNRVMTAPSTTEPGAPTIGTATATGTTTATVSFTAPASDGGSTIISYTASSNPGSITATITQAGSGTILVTGLSPSTSYSFTVTALNSVGASSASSASNSITTLGTGIAPLFTSASSYDGRFTVQVTNYDEAFTYAVSSSAGQVSISSSGLITVTGLRPDQSVTVTVTTTKTGYASGSGSVTGRSQVAPMLPGTKPTVTLSDTLITCTIGSYSAAPTSSAFSLFVDGKHISTNFSALGDYLPDWIIPWATSSTITRTATLTSATWAMSDAFKGKSITCATLAYSKNAIGFTASQVMVAK